MTPAQQKAEELVKKFSTIDDAILAVDEILINYDYQANQGISNLTTYFRKLFWQEVKQHLTTLIK